MNQMKCHTRTICTFGGNLSIFMYMFVVVFVRLYVCIFYRWRAHHNSNCRQYFSYSNTCCQIHTHAYAQHLNAFQYVSNGISLWFKWDKNGNFGNTSNCLFFVVVVVIVSFHKKAVQWRYMQIFHIEIFVFENDQP